MDGGSIYETTIGVKVPLTYVSMSLRARSYASYSLESQLASGVLRPQARSRFTHRAFRRSLLHTWFRARPLSAPSLPCLTDQEDASWRVLMELGTTLMGKKVTMSYLSFSPRDTDTGIRTRTRRQQ